MAQHDLGEYQVLINGFVDGRLGVGEFEPRYLRMFKEDSTRRPDAEYEVLIALFSAVDALCENPDTASVVLFGWAAVACRGSNSLAGIGLSNGHRVTEDRQIHGYDRPEPQ